MTTQRAATRHHDGQMTAEHVQRLEEVTTYVQQLRGDGASTAETLAALPDPATLWSTLTPDVGFGAGGDKEWSGTGDGVTTTFGIAGRITTAKTRYVVIVGGVQQSPGVFTLPADTETIVFAGPPPAGVSIVVYAPFYGEAV